MPEFHPDYGLTEEEQVARVVQNMEKFAEFLSKTASFLTGVSIEEIGKNLARLLIAITNKDGESWQITEGRELLVNLELLEEKIEEFGKKNTEAKRYFKNEFIPKEMMKTGEKELSTRALRYILGKMDLREVKATLGY